MGLAHINAKSNYTDTDGAGANNVYMKESENNFAWQVGAGVGYALNEKVTLNAGYRYTDLGSVETTAKNASGGINTKTDFESHEVMLGARYAF